MGTYDEHMRGLHKFEPCSYCWSCRAEAYRKSGLADWKWKPFRAISGSYTTVKTEEPQKKPQKKPAGSEAGYFRHLCSNWKVTFKCLVLALFRFAHGVLPVEATSHEYWGIWSHKEDPKLEEQNKGGGDE